MEGWMDGRVEGWLAGCAVTGCTCWAQGKHCLEPLPQHQHTEEVVQQKPEAFSVLLAVCMTCSSSQEQFERGCSWTQDWLGR